MKDPTLILAAAVMALRSYQHGNPKPELARDAADTIERWMETTDVVEKMVEDAGGRVGVGSFMQLPDGSGACTATFPLPKDHWLYQPAGEPPAHWRVGEGRVRAEHAAQITEAARWAIRVGTASGKEGDFDPDAMVQSFVLGMLGYWTHDGYSHADDENGASYE